MQIYELFFKINTFFICLVERTCFNRKKDQELLKLNSADILHFFLKFYGNMNRLLLEFFCQRKKDDSSFSKLLTFFLFHLNNLETFTSSLSLSLVLKGTDRMKWGIYQHILQNIRKRLFHSIECCTQGLFERKVVNLYMSFDFFQLKIHRSI